MAATEKINFSTLVSYSFVQTVFSWDLPFCHTTKRHRRQTDRQTDRQTTLDHTIRKYAHGLLLESPFVPPSTDC